MTEDSKFSTSTAVEGAVSRSWVAHGRAGTALGIAIAALAVSGGALAVALYVATRDAPTSLSPVQTYAYQAWAPQIAHPPYAGAQVWGQPQTAPVVQAAAPAPAAERTRPLTEADLERLAQRLLENAPVQQATLAPPAQIAAGLDPLLAPPAAAAAPSATEISRAADEAYERAQAILRASQTDQLAINQILNDPDSAGPILEAFDIAVGIDMPAADGAEGRPIFAFFDPRCPYCHQAILGLEGAANIRWLPVLTLGAGGEPLTRQILGAVVAEKDEAGVVTSLSLPPDEGRLARLRLVGAGQNARLPTMEPDAEQEQAIQAVLGENLGGMAQLYGPQRSSLAVPTFLIPRADGSAVVLRGYSEGTKEQILEEMRRGG